MFIIYTSNVCFYIFILYYVNIYIIFFPSYHIKSPWPIRIPSNYPLKMETPSISLENYSHCQIFVWKLSSKGLFGIFSARRPACFGSWIVWKFGENLQIPRLISLPWNFHVGVHIWTNPNDNFHTFVTCHFFLGRLHCQVWVSVGAFPRVWCRSMSVCQTSNAYAWIPSGRWTRWSISVDSWIVWKCFF